MKREILFRGKAINNTFSINEKEAKIKIGDWIYGAVIPFDDNIDLIYERDPNNPKICGCHGIEVDHNTVGQFTGIYDENGTPIFEGDIIHFSYYDTEYDTGYTKHIVVEEMVKFEYGSFCIKHYPFILERCFNMNDDDKLVVIGNFYDGKNNCKI